MKLTARLGIAGILVSVWTGLFAQSPTPAITEFSVGAAGANGPSAIILGVDGALWFTDTIANQIGRITPAGVVTTFSIPTPNAQPTGITLGPDGAFWFTEYAADKIGRITAAGIITEYAVTAASNPRSIVSGPNGTLLFTEGTGNKIGRITTGGILTAEYMIPTPASSPWGIVQASDTAFWFTEFNGNKIGRITSAGIITEYSLPLANSHPQYLTAGPDGALWFTENAGRIGRITTAGVIKEYNAPVPGSIPVGIVTGLDGALWYTAANTNNLGRITVAGLATEFPTTNTDSGILQIVVGPDSALWFTQSKSGQIGHAVWPNTVPSVIGYPASHDFLSAATPNRVAAGRDGAIWLTTFVSVARLTMDGGLSEYTQINFGFSAPNGIAAGPDGSMWFTQPDTSRIGRITADGILTQYTVPCHLCSPIYIVAGPDQNLWFNELNGVNIGRITTTGEITEFPVGVFTGGITLGPDGALWLGVLDFLNNSVDIGRLTTQGEFTRFSLPSGYSQTITVGADGALWIPGAGKIARMTTAGVVTEFGGITGNVSELILGADGALWFMTPGYIGRITTTGSIVQYPGSFSSANSTMGPDGALWVIGGGFNSIGRTALPPGPSSNITKVIGSNFPGLQLTVDGVSYFAPATFQWPIGSLHTISAGTPVNPHGIRYSFGNWSDGQPQSHTIAASIAPTVLIANIVPQYLLTSAASPAAGGSITTNPFSSDGFYDYGKSVQISTTPNPGYQFCCFTGDLSGSTIPQAVSMIAPRSVTAVFNSSSCVFTLSSNSALDGGSGGSGSVGVSTLPGCSWSAQSNVSWITVTSSPMNTGNDTVTYSISPAPGVARTGTMTIVGQTFTITQSVPAAVSVGPAFGTGLTQTFTMQFSDSAGWQNITVVDILINRALDGRNACYIAFVTSGVAAGSVFLVNDAGDSGGPYQGMVLPGSSTIQNSQCKLDGTGSSVSASGNILTITLAVTFTSSFAGNKVVYMAARDLVQSPGWVALGTWNVPGAAQTGPAVGGMNPARSSTRSQTYTFTFTDTNGWADLSVANILINSAIDGRAACYLAFVPSGAGSGSLLLVNDAGAAAGPYSGMVLPGSGTIQNSQCIIDGSGSSVATNGTTLTLTIAVTFNPTFTGSRVFYLAARSNTLNSNWQAVGSVTVP